MAKECISKVTGKALSAYESKKEAEESAKYAKEKYGQSLYAYKCENCGKYHLAPKESKIDVKKNACSCRDSNGQPKALYGSKKDAEKQMEKSQVEQNIKLRVYKCLDGLGWHLTHTAPIEEAKKPAAKKSETASKIAKTKSAKTTEKKTAATKKTTAKKAKTAAAKTKAPVKKESAKKTPAVKKTTGVKAAKTSKAKK